MTKHDQLAIGRVTVLYTFLNRKIVVFFKGHGLGLWSGLPKKIKYTKQSQTTETVKKHLGHFHDGSRNMGISKRLAFPQ
jgi:hypothetical protein